MVIFQLFVRYLSDAILGRGAAGAALDDTATEEKKEE